MLIERELSDLVVYSQDAIGRALEKISANRSHVVFCVDEHGRLLGSLTDGDFRRWAAPQARPDLATAAIEVAHRDPVSASVDAAPASIERLFAPGIDLIPLVDRVGHLKAVAIRRDDRLQVGRHLVDDDSPALVIAEIGINHNGSVDLARELVDRAVAAGADVVKFQLRDLDALYRQGSDRAGEDLGPQYTLDLLARFNLPAEQLFTVFDHCRDVGIEVMCTAWDPPSVQQLADYGVPALKVASADLTNHALLREMAATGRPLVISTGMSTEQEIRESVAVVRESAVPFALLHCQSTYPAPFKDLNLRYLTRLAEIGGCPVGYSGHERGFHIAVAAVALGAKIIEKHITLDRSMEGNDHQVSLLPDEFAAMVQQIREVESALGTSAPRSISTGEQMNRVNLAKSLVATRALALGETIAAADVTIKSPGRGLQPNGYDRLVGRATIREIAAGDFFYPADLGDAALRGRQFRFRRPWGLPVRWHDVDALTADCTPDFLEFHFSYADLEVDVEEVMTAVAAEAGFDRPLPMGYACHSPDLFTGDFLLNLASDDDAIWERSIAELQRVIDLTRSLRPWFAGSADSSGIAASQDPVVIASLGGFTKSGHVAPSALPAMYDRVAAGLARLDETGVRLCAQTLPPFPWYLGGQLFCNLFVGAEDTAAFAERHGRRLCLDVSHTKLAANYAARPFAEVVGQLAPYADHLHLVDATGIDGEGVQVGDGDIDWPELIALLDEHCPQAGFIPEIWQGHVNNGEGFWVALERLETWG
ncbi:MAG: N-acetylneuraminate synthase family protein [Nocardioides sp.]